MRKFRPINNVQITCATCPQQAEAITEFLNKHADHLGCKFTQDGCTVRATRIKPSRIQYIIGVIAGYLLSK